MANTTNFGWETPDDTDLVKDGALAMRTLGNAIDTSLVDLKGGTTGQILAKNTNTDMDFVWITNDQGDITEVVAGTGLSGGGASGSVTLTNTVATAYDAKGDFIVGTGADTFARLAVGTNGQYLTADSSTATGLAWATPADISCRCIQNASTNLSTTFASIAFQTEDFDTDTMHDNSTNNSRITIKTAGKYSVGGQITTATNAALGARILLNGATVIARQFQGNSASTEGANLSTIYDFALNDYIELQGALGSGSGTTSADGNTNFWAVKL